MALLLLPFHDSALYNNAPYLVIIKTNLSPFHSLLHFLVPRPLHPILFHFNTLSSLSLLSSSLPSTHQYRLSSSQLVLSPPNLCSPFHPMTKAPIRPQSLHKRPPKLTQRISSSHPYTSTSLLQNHIFTLLQLYRIQLNETFIHLAHCSIKNPTS